MQTVYYTTANFIRHNGNVVDLTEYRRRMERAAKPLFPQEPERTAAPAVSRARRRFRGAVPGLFPDFFASAAIVVMTVIVAVQFIG